MSLRIFHIVFVTLSIALSLFVTIWGTRQYMATRDGSALGIAIVFALGGIALIVYAGRAFRKLKELT